MKTVNPLVQLGIQVRRRVRQVTRGLWAGELSSQTDASEGISHHREGAFISCRASSQHLPLDRTE